MDVANQSRALYVKGVEHEQASSYTDAMECYLQSAAFGYGRSEFRLGIFYLEGKACTPDKAKAYSYFLKAANHDNRDQSKACFNLALMLENGDGIPKDLTQALHWYRQAANLGNTNAISKVEALQQKLPDCKVKKNTTATSSTETTATSTSATATTPQVTLKKISYPELELQTEIGKGNFGIVYKATWRQSEIVAVKKIHAEFTENGAKEFSNESKIIGSFASQRLVRLIGVCSPPDPYCLIMEYMEKGTLEKVLHSNEYLSWPCRLQIILDVIQGLSYLHQENIIHRDLRSKNILLDSHNHSKLTNFGLAKVKQQTSTKITSIVGATAWLAPEVFGLKPKYTYASDVYALGMVMWEVLTRKTPYATKTPTEIRTLVKSGKREECPTNTPPAYQQLIETCWQENITRPQASQIAIEIQNQLKIAEASLVKSWHCSPELKPKVNTNEPYCLIDVPPNNTDIQKVIACYQRYPISNMDIKNIRIIYNLEFNRAFQARLIALQNRHNNPGFTPKWSQENNPSQREAILTKLEQMSLPYKDNDCPNVKIIPMWHGTKPTILDSIFKTGYANLATTDPGFYGKGIYSTYEAEYAHRVYSQGAMLVNYVATYSAYPVIDGDTPKLTAGANYQNYDAHFIPVKPAPDEANYFPCQAHEPAIYHELVVFESAQCFPRYLVELQPTLPKEIKGKQKLKNT